MSRSILQVLALAMAFIIPVSAQTAMFTDQTVATGVVASHVPTYTASFAAGGAVGDFNRDGFQDIFIPSGGGVPDRLFINNGNGTFTDQAAAWGVAIAHRSTGAAVGDFDGDGWLDIYVTSLGPAGNDAPGFHRLYKNNGGASFTDVAAAMGVATTSQGQADGWGACWGDYDLDGDLDLCVAGWITNTNVLFRNDGTTFTAVTAAAGLGALSQVNGFTPRFVDMDGDLYPELIFIGDFSTSRYFKNNGDGTFTDVTASSGTSQDGTEMGMTVGDFDEDGLFDFYVTTISTNNLYMNQGNNTFLNQASTVGVANTQWGWGTVATDFDNDTFLDIVATTQSGRQYAFQSTATAPSQLSFNEVALTIGLNTSISGRGLANFDYDNDGDQDLVFFPFNGPIKVFRNDLSGTGNTHWLRVFLDRGNNPFVAPDGIGCKVTIQLGSRQIVRFIDGGSNYASQSELSAFFGLGTATSVNQVTVEWSDGTVSVLNNVVADQAMTVVANFNPATAILQSISPDSVAEGSATFTLSLQGSNFDPASVVRLDGVAVPTTFLSTTLLHAQVAASVVANAGTVNVTVDNAAIGGALSATRTLTVLAPSLGVAGSGLSTLKINGSTGGAPHRVDIALGAPLTITMDQPASNPNPSLFAIWGFVGVPDASSVFTFPGVVGSMAFTPCAAFPAPNTFTLVNTFFQDPCGAFTGALATPFSVSATAPTAPLTFTLQGVVLLAPAGNPLPIFTNGVIAHIR